jgi:hypothetical protein
MVNVERHGGIVDGIDDDVSAADVARRDRGAGEGPGEQLRAKPLTVQRAVER